MASTDTIARVAPYAERLLDDYIYDQLEDATERLHRAYELVSRRPARKALEDKRLRNQVRGAVTSIRNAALAAAGREREPKRSRAPRLLLGLAATAGFVVLVRRRREKGRELDYLDLAPASAEESTEAVDDGERLPAA